MYHLKKGTQRYLKLDPLTGKYVCSEGIDDWRLLTEQDIQYYRNRYTPRSFDSLKKALKNGRMYFSPSIKALCEIIEMRCDGFSMNFPSSLDDDRPPPTHDDPSPPSHDDPSPPTPEPEPTVPRYTDEELVDTFKVKPKEQKKRNSSGGGVQRCDYCKKEMKDCKEPPAKIKNRGAEIMVSNRVVLNRWRVLHNLPPKTPAKKRGRGEEKKEEEEDVEDRPRRRVRGRK